MGRRIRYEHRAGSPRQSLALVRVGRVTGGRHHEVEQELVVQLEQGVCRTPLLHDRLGATGGGAIVKLRARWRRAWHGGVRAAWLQVREREGCLDGERGAWRRSRRRAALLPCPSGKALDSRGLRSVERAFPQSRPSWVLSSDPATTELLQLDSPFDLFSKVLDGAWESEPNLGCDAGQTDP